MRLLQVEIIVRTIEVGGHHRDEVGAILEVIALAEFKSGDFGDGVGFVGIFELTGQEVLLLHGLGRFARVDARGSQEEQLFHPVEVRLVDNVVLDLQVFVNELPAVGVVGHDAPHTGGRQHDIVGFLFREEQSCGLLVQQVQFFDGAACQMGIAFG